MTMSKEAVNFITIMCFFFLRQLNTACEWLGKVSVSQHLGVRL